MYNQERISVTVCSGPSMYCRTAACKTGSLPPSGSYKVLGHEAGYLKDLVSLIPAWNKVQPQKHFPAFLRGGHQLPLQCATLRPVKPKAQSASGGEYPAKSAL